MSTETEDRYTARMRKALDFLYEVLDGEHVPEDMEDSEIGDWLAEAESAREDITNYLIRYHVSIANEIHDRQNERSKLAELRYAA